MSRPVFRVLTPRGADVLLGVLALALPLVGWAVASAYLFPAGAQ